MIEPPLIDLLRLLMIGVVVYVSAAQLWQFAQARHDRVYMWVAAWLLLSAAMLLARVIQHTVQAPASLMWPTHLLVASGLAIAPVAVSAAHSFLRRPPTRVVRVLQITGAVLVVLALFTGWLFYWAPVRRTDALGREFYAASLGALSPAVLLYAAAAMAYCLHVFRQARHLVDDTARFLVLVPLAVLMVLSVNDVLMLMGVITSIHVSDFGAAAVGIAFSYAHARRSREYYIALERDGALREKLVESVIEAQEVERERIARDLHDSTGQTLTSLTVRLRAAEQADDLEGLRDQVREIRALTKGALEQVRHVARGLHPATLDDFGFETALNQHIAELRTLHEVDIDVIVSGFDTLGRLPSSVELAMYRIAQEALANAIRHASPTTVSVVVDRTRARARMIIEDNGCGFDVEAARGLGLLSMRERAIGCDGTVTIESTVGAGTGVFVVMPISKRAMPPRPASV